MKKKTILVIAMLLLSLACVFAGGSKEKKSKAVTPVEATAPVESKSSAPAAASSAVETKESPKFPYSVYSLSKSFSKLSELSSDELYKDIAVPASIFADVSSYAELSGRIVAVVDEENAIGGLYDKSFAVAIVPESYSVDSLSSLSLEL